MTPWPISQVLALVLFLALSIIEDIPVVGALQARVSGATPGDGASGFSCARVMVYNALSKLPNQTEASQVGPL
jgi:hypothetical protein